MNVIKYRFGSYRGYVTHLKAQAAAALGAYSSAERIDFSRVNRFVFVCKGNVCRSPYAEARARELGLPAVSFGLETTGGVPANSVALRIAGQRGIDLSEHESRPLDPDQIQSDDLMIAFEPPQLEELTRRVADRSVQRTLIGLWADRARVHVPDPYGKCDEYFYNCFTLCDLAIQRLAALKARKLVEAG